MISCKKLSYASHIFIRHPEVHTIDIEKCVRNPNEIYIDTNTQYYMLLRKLNDKWICCVVDKCDNECIIASAWYMYEEKKRRYVFGKLRRGEWKKI